LHPQPELFIRLILNDPSHQLLHLVTSSKYLCASYNWDVSKQYLITFIAIHNISLLKICEDKLFLLHDLGKDVNSDLHILLKHSLRYVITNVFLSALIIVVTFSPTAGSVKDAESISES
jgi:hypothetical protein